ncbi:MAG: flavodoxin family protein [Lachnospiraceae bacterium]|nr:flavodoxin family protein [Lachnospiraceae bacterium]
MDSQTKEKRICILRGSPRADGNTNELTDISQEELESRGAVVTSFTLYDMKLLPCRACRICQSNWSVFGCPLDDEMERIFDAVMAADLILLSTPVYSWYCTPPLKIVMDRMVYGMNKYYGEEKGPSLWEGKHLALITTCGYPVEKGADLLEEGLRRYCRHSKLRYDGMLAERHMGYGTTFMDAGKAERAADFAAKLMTGLQG